MGRQLTAKQKAFCEEYVANGYKAVQAYMDAYGVAHDTAAASTRRTLKSPVVQAYLKELQKDAYEQACINAERVALKLGEIAFAEKSDEYYTPNQQLKALDLLQKQLGLQTSKVEADLKNNINITIEE